MKKWIVFLLTLLLLSGCSPQMQHTLEFVDGRMVTTGDGTELVGVFCNYTNLSGETGVICDGIHIKAFQNGVEIPVMVYPENIENAVPCDTSVQAGASAYVVWTFANTDSSAVSVEFTDGQTFVFPIAEES